MSCPVNKEKFVEALKVAQEMSEFLDKLKCPKAKEIVSKWKELTKECPRLQECKNEECPCGEDCECIKRNGVCNCEYPSNSE